MRILIAVYVALVFVIISMVNCAVLPKNYTIKSYIDNPAIKLYREYVQIDTSKEENIAVAAEFWRKRAKELDLVFAEYRPAGKPICVLTWPGTDTAKPSIMLNSHMDVVPVEANLWTYPPFSAHIDENGDIFGRGTQDDKDVSIQYLEAIRRLKENNVTLQRTLHLTLMPDEEIGGFNGMVEFIKTKEFSSMNIGFALDEGITSSSDTLYFTYQDKRAWQIKISVRGASGHSSTIVEATAVEKINKIMNEIDAYRQKQRQILNARDAYDYGAYDSVNINILSGHVAVNVVPAQMHLVVDVRWAVDKEVDEIQETVDSWIAMAGNGTKVEYIRRMEQSEATCLNNSLYWTAIQDWAYEIGAPIQPVVCPATSDMVLLRARGIPALGFAPKTHTESRMHGADEYLNAATFLKGIDLYATLLQKLGDL